MINILDGNTSAAWATKLSRVMCVPAFPITPQTELMEVLAKWSADGLWGGELKTMESEHAVLSAAIASEMTGARTFTATSSQGIMLMHEMLPIASGTRTPLVMVNVSRGLSAPVTLWCFTEKAQVLMADLTYKKISEIRKGDIVLGVRRVYGGGDFVPAKVKNTFARHTNEIVRIKTDKFDLVCTPDHKFYYHPTHGHWAKAMFLKNKELKWIGYGFEENDEFMRGWLSGMTDGDGCLYDFKIKGHVYCRFQLNVKDKDIIDTFIKYASHFGFNIRKHDYRKKDGQYGAIISKHEEAQQFKEFIKPLENFDFCRGYLSGLYDAEGTGPYEKGKALSIYNTNHEIIERAVSCIKFLGFKCKTYVNKRRGRSDCTTIIISSAPEFFVMCRPNVTRKCGNMTKTTIKAVKKKLKINDVEFLKTGDTVYNIETETNNYIVNGFLVHNCDHNDFLAMRDSGWLMFSCETNQEVLDTIIMAYKVSEKVLVPSLVNMDGFIHSYTREEVDVPEQKKADTFLPKLKLKIKIDVDEPKSFGVPVMHEYSFFRSQLHKAHMDAKKEIKKAHTEWKKLFRRKYCFVDEYNLDDADVAIVSIGANCTTMKAAASSIKNAGIARLRVLRPFPAEDLEKSLAGIKKIVVIDQNIAPGIGGILYPEIKSVLPDAIVSSCIAGLGGKPVSQKDYKTIARMAMKSKKPFRKMIV